MNPTPDTIAWIRSYVATLPGGWDTSVPDIVAAANTPTVPNPAPQPTVPKPFYVTDLVAHLDAETLASLRTLPSLPRVLDDINSNNRAGCNLWLNLLLASTDITQQQHDALAAVINATYPDPSWPSQVGAAEANLGRPIDQLDVLGAKS